MRTEPDDPPMITFSEQCPVTKNRHSFTSTRHNLLSARRLEGFATGIRYSTTAEAGLGESRCRALMEVISKVIAWEAGLTPEHPILLDVGPHPASRKRRRSTELGGDDELEKSGNKTRKIRKALEKRFKELGEKTEELERTTKELEKETKELGRKTKELGRKTGKVDTRLDDAWGSAFGAQLVMEEASGILSESVGIMLDALDLM